MKLTTFIALALASWRVANLLTDTTEAGPGDVLHKLRHLMGVRFDEYSQPYGLHFVGDIFACIWCMSVWVGFGFGLGYLIWRKGVENLIAYPLGLAGSILLFNRIIKGK